MRTAIYKKHLTFLLIFFSVIMIANNGVADNRRYAWTYEYQTLSPGKGEVESYFTLSAPDIKHMKGTTSTEHQLELEVGMTDRFDFGIYQVFQQNPGEGLHYEGYKLRARYKFGEKGEYFFNPLVYLEYIGKPDFSEHEIEGKLILAKDIGRLNISLNPILSLEREDEWKLKPEYAIGTSYEVSDLFRVGIEAKGGEDGNYIGPVVSHGRENLWVALGSAIKVGTIKNGKPEFQLRMLLGIGF